MDVEAIKAKYPQLSVLPSSGQLLAIHAIIRDRTTHRNDFVFYCDRLIRLLVEEGLNLLPYQEKTVTTPTGELFTGVDFTAKLCGVSIMRAGESMESALRETAKNVRIGKILIQRDETSVAKEPKLYYCKLPQDIASRTVILMDPMIATGGSAMMAIEVLKSRGVDEARIIFLNVVSCPKGIDNVLTRFPNVRIVSTMVDPGLNDDMYILPGLGDFGDRYFGTDE